MATADAVPKYELKEVDLDLIKVEEDFNARKEFDPEQLEALGGAMEDVGVFQTLTLRPSEEGDGTFTIVAGERRYRSALAKELKTMPAMVGDLTRRDALLISFFENEHRSDLNPIERAQCIKAVAEEWELSTQKEIAAKANIKKSAEVGTLLRLLDLPEGVQRLIASRDIPVAAEKRLREVAAVSPRVAECVCEFAKRKEVSHTEFLRSFNDLLKATSGAKFNTNPPTMINTWRPELRELVPDKKAREALRRRLNEAKGADFEEHELQFGEEEEMAARAAGCLLEPPPSKHAYSHGSSYITDQELAADLAVRYVETVEKWVEKQREAAEERAEANAERGDDGESVEDKAAARRKAENEERKEAKEIAVAFNEQFGVNLIKQRGGKARKQRSLARGKAIAKLFLAQNQDLAARGLRLVMPQLRSIEQKTLKSGKPGKAKLVFATTEDCIEFLNKRVDDATSADELNEILAESVIAGMEADATATTHKEYVSWSPSSSAESSVKKLLRPDIKDARPRRRAVKKRK